MSNMYSLTVALFQVCRTPRLYWYAAGNQQPTAPLASAVTVTRTSDNAIASPSARPIVTEYISASPRCSFSMVTGTFSGKPVICSAVIRISRFSFLVSIP